MENQRRLANNINRYEAGHSGVPRNGAALLQGIAVCGQCGRRMILRYSGPAGDYPVYTCRTDREQDGGPPCQETKDRSHRMESSCATSANGANRTSMSTLEWAADIWVRMRACPFGTTGNEKPMT
nr:zinc ribbon domain-containing protein [Mesorhizobium sp. L103C105A0]